eukprot:GDKK01076948.1.p1 GENE.GDKK01076948.1~~GDKK01076948.1.p1  ORF type:complete len:506 (-),score=133.87 GDKK01076948.1:270-1787(-)
MGISAMNNNNTASPAANQNNQFWNNQSSNSSFFSNGRVMKRSSSFHQPSSSSPAVSLQSSSAQPQALFNLSSTASLNKNNFASSNHLLLGQQPMIAATLHQQEAMAAVEKATSLQEKVTSAHNELRTIRGQLARSKEKAASLETDNAILKNKMSELELSNRDLLESGNKTKALEVQLSRLKTELAISKNSEQNARTQLLSIESLAEGDRRELLRLREKMEQIMEENEKFKSNHGDSQKLQSEITALKNENINLLSEKEKSLKENERFSRENEMLSTRCKLLDVELENTKDEQKRLSLHLEQSESQLTFYKRECDVGAAKIRNLEKEKTRLSRDIMELNERQHQSKLSSSQSQLDLIDHASMAASLRLQLDSQKKAKTSIQKDAKLKEAELESVIEGLREDVKSKEEMYERCQRFTKFALGESGTLIRAVASLASISAIKSVTSQQQQQPSTLQMMMSFSLSEASSWMNDVTKNRSLRDTEGGSGTWKKLVAKSRRAAHSPRTESR